MRFLGRKVLEEICFKLVIAGVTYCIAVWETVSNSKFEQLEAVHRRAARLVYDLSSTDDALEKAKWQPISYIYKEELHQLCIKFLMEIVLKTLKVSSRKRQPVRREL